MKFFDLDGPLIQLLNKMADLMWLNILTMVCCIPIFTAGASLTALHYMALKIVRNEECYITKGFFKSFRQNFGQATLIWLLLIAVAAVLGGDFYIITKTDVEINRVLRIVIMAIGILALFTAMMVFPMQAKFANPVSRTIKNAFTVGILQFPKTMIMMILTALPVLILYFFWRLIPLVFFFGFSIPAYLSAMMYNKTFLRMEEQFLDAHASEYGEDADDGERIFSDRLEEEMTEE